MRYQITRSSDLFGEKKPCNKAVLENRMMNDGIELIMVAKREYPSLLGVRVCQGIY